MLWNPLRRTAAIVVLVSLLLLTGCGYDYRSKIDPVVQAYALGQYAVASQKAVEACTSDSKAHRDRLVWLLEQGNTLRASGRFDQSNQAFDEADQLFEKFDGKAKVRLDREAVSALASPAALAYEGYGYDRIMTNVYKAANYLESGRPVDARIEIRRIADSQDRCEERYKNKIKQAEDARKNTAKETGYQIDMDRAAKDQKLKTGQAELISDFPEAGNEKPLDDLTHKTLYLNPFAEYLQGLFYLHSDVAGEKEVGRVAIRNAAGMAPRNQALQRELADAEKIASFAPVNPKTYIIFETGMAPRRTEIRIDIPIFLVSLAMHQNLKVHYVGIAFPKLKTSEGHHFAHLSVSSVDGTVQTETLTDMDRIVAREFKDEMPLIITRAIIGAATKAAIQYAVSESTKKQDAWVQVLTGVATTAYSAAMNEADLRTFRTLPKYIQIASCQTPIDGRVHLRFGREGASPTTVAVKPGKSNVVWVRCPTSSAVPLIRAFPLN